MLDIIFSSTSSVKLCIILIHSSQHKNKVMVINLSSSLQGEWKNLFSFDLQSSICVLFFPVDFRHESIIVDKVFYCDFVFSLTFLVLRCTKNVKQKTHNKTLCQEWYFYHFYHFFFTNQHLFTQCWQWNTRARWEICSKLTIKTLELHLCHSGIFIINFEQIS